MINFEMSLLENTGIEKETKLDRVSCEYTCTNEYLNTLFRFRAKANENFSEVGAKSMYHALH